MKKFFIFLFVLSALCGCGGGKETGNAADKKKGDIHTYENTPVDPVEQASPVIMVLPADQLMKRYGALRESRLHGTTEVERDYQQYLLANTDNAAVISAIQDAFAEAGFPVQSLEQILKQLATREATDMADRLEKDAKTLLLTVAQPDIIVELDYRNSINMRGPLDTSSNMEYTVNVLDSYTGNVITSFYHTSGRGESPARAMANSLKVEMRPLLGKIGRYFDEIRGKGRNVTVRIAVANGSGISLENRSPGGDTYADWIIDYMKTHTVKGAYKLQSNTAKELYFTNCRIRLNNSDGTQYGVYDWARDMTRSMWNELGLDCSNKAQGLGEILITINGK